jgi:hypothetical protein
MDIPLGQNTPEKNSVAGSTTANPQVICAAVDGSGPSQITSADTLDVTSTWQAKNADGSAVNGGGSVSIKLSQTGGHDLFIQSLKVCQNGVSGTIYFLCSAFVPDP